MSGHSLRSTQSKAVIAALCVLLACTSLVSPKLAADDTDQQPVIAIIIDDMGNHFQNGLDLIRLPYPLTLSFLPGRPHSAELSKLARIHDKEIMLHEPMENILGLQLGKGGLTESMSEYEIKSSLAASLSSIPHIMGINNHMGSKLTTNSQTMRWVMEKLTEYPVYFVDSRTSPDSIAAQTALDYQIPNLSRDVFLDHRQTRKFVQQQFLKLLEIAREKGTAIAIAHPHRVTIDYLNRALQKLDEKGIGIASISALWQIQHPTQRMFAHRKNQQREWILAQQRRLIEDSIIQ